MDNSKIPFIDEWVTEKQYDKSDEKFRLDGVLVHVEFDKIFNKPEWEVFNTFSLKKKTAYTREPLVYEIVGYINYFIKYFDPEQRFLGCCFNNKMLCDIDVAYDEDLFIHDLKYFFLTDYFKECIDNLTQYNYYINLSKKEELLQNNESLEYTTEHGKIIMNIATAMKLMIPMITHYAHMRKIRDVNTFVLKCFSMIIQELQGELDFYNKLTETIYSKVIKSVAGNKGTWETQKIRGHTFHSFTHDCAAIVIYNGVPKYKYSGNIVNLNTAIIGNQIKNFLRTPYEMDFNQISEVNRDEDGLSDYDKMEISVAKEDESEIISRKKNVQQTIKYLKKKYGEVSDEEISFYMQNGSRQEFQQNLVFLLFADYFGSTTQRYSCSFQEYSTLVILMKRRLEDLKFTYLQHLLSARVKDRTNVKRSINKATVQQIDQSPTYEYIMKNKYSFTSKILKRGEVLNKILTSLLANEYELVEYSRPDLLHKDIILNKNVICSEFLRFVSMV